MIQLEKGDSLEVSLKHICVGLGWQAQTNGSDDFDLDASAFMVGADKQIPEEPYFVYYNGSKNASGYVVSPDGAAKHWGDNLTGGTGVKDDETIEFFLDKVNPNVLEIDVVASIYHYKQRSQTFGDVKNAYIRIYDCDTKDEIAKYDLADDFSGMASVEFGKLVRKGANWRFEAVGLGHQYGLDGLVQKYAKNFI